MTTPPVPPSSDPTPGAAPVERASIWEDFLDIYIKPVDVFRRRVDGRFGIPLLVLVVLSLIVYFATRQWTDPLMEAETLRAVSRDPRVTAEQAQQAASMFSRFAVVVVVLFIPVAVLLTGTLTWILGKFLDIGLTWSQGATIATYSMFPRVIEGIVNGAQAAMMDPSSLVGRSVVSIGPARFFDPVDTDPMLQAVLLRLDVFTLWCVVLLGVGIYVIGQTSKAKAAVLAGVMWLLGTLYFVWSVRPKG